MSKSKSESGDAINISNLKKLIDNCTAFGADYDPSNEDLTIASLTNTWQKDDAKEKNYLSLVQGTRVPVADRQSLFAPLEPLVTRVLGELDSSKASDHLKELARNLGNDIRGKSHKKEEPPKDGNADEELETVSQSHLSYVNKAKNFYSLVELLKTIPEYKPKKEDLTIASLADYSTNLAAANDGLESKLTGAKNAGIELKKLLYEPQNGLVDTALACKSYVKGLFGASDARFKLVNGIKFKNLGLR